MVIYKSILAPKVLQVSSGLKNEDGSVNVQDYGLWETVVLDDWYERVTLRTIRFTIAYPVRHNESPLKIMSHPYQVHFRWFDGSQEVYQPGKVVQNTMLHNISDGVLVQNPQVSSSQATYSTFCQAMSTSYVAEPDHDETLWHFYELQRDAVIKQGSFKSLTFELFFTNLKGERIYRYLPNVEIELELE